MTHHRFAWRLAARVFALAAFTRLASAQGAPSAEYAGAKTCLE